MDIAVNQRRYSRSPTCSLAQIHASCIVQLANGIAMSFNRKISKANKDLNALRTVVNLTVIKSARKG
jgi:hypothetical protein